MASELDVPPRYDRAIARMVRSRHLTLGAETLARHAADHGAAALSPLADRRFAAALAAAGGRHGPRGRTAAMRAMAADLLPDELLARRDKAHFHEAFFGPPAREMAGRLTRDVLPRVVEPEALRAALGAPVPDFRGTLMLQFAWLMLARVNA
jgi:hypothetical protein